MTRYVKTTGGIGGAVANYPYTISDFRAENPQVSIPTSRESAFAAFDIYPVDAGVAEPVYDPNTHRIEQSSAPTYNGVNWELEWNTIALSVAEKFQKTMSSAGSAFSGSEKIILLALYAEVKLFRSDNTVDTPLIDAIKTNVFPAQSKAQIGTSIEGRVQNFLETAAVALAQKMKDGG